MIIQADSEPDVKKPVQFIYVNRVGRIPGPFNDVIRAKAFQLTVLPRNDRIESH